MKRLPPQDVTVQVDEALVMRAAKLLGLAALGMPASWRRRRLEAAAIERALLEAVSDDKLPVYTVYLD